MTVPAQAASDRRYRKQAEAEGLAGPDTVENAATESIGVGHFQGAFVADRAEAMSLAIPSVIDINVTRLSGGGILVNAEPRRLGSANEPIEELIGGHGHALSYPLLVDGLSVPLP